MNCLRCNAPLEDQARFCRNCGYAAPAGVPVAPLYNDSGAPTVETRLNAPQSQPQMPQPQPQYANPQTQWQPSQGQPTSQPQQWNQVPMQPIPQPSQAQWMPPTQAVQPSYAQQGAAGEPGSMQSVGAQPEKGAGARRRKRKWPLRVLITLVVLVVLIVGGWFLAGRPILHSVAQTQFNQLITNQENLIVPLPPVVSSLAVTENLLNNMITLGHAPSDPVQNAVAHISPPVINSDGSYTGGVRLDFKLYGFACSIAAIPVVSNGQITMTQVQVGGILSLVMSSDEMTTLLNTQLQNAVSRMHRQIVGLTLKQQEMDIQLGSVVV